MSFRNKIGNKKMFNIYPCFIKSENDDKLFLILGNKTNSNNDNKSVCVRKEDGIKFANKHYSNYLEVSIEEKQNLKNLIKNLIDQFLIRKYK